MEEQLEKNLMDYFGEVLKECEKCRLCNLVCPVWDNRITQGPFGIHRAIHYSVMWDKFDEHTRALVYSCTTCGKCVDRCEKVSRALPLREVFEKAREWLLVEKEAGPMPDQVGVLKNMHVRGNPWGIAPHERTKWAEGLEVPFVSKDNKVDVLYFVGCASSYDAQAQKIAKNLTKLLKSAGVKFGILENETCSGSEARRMGETGLFEYLSEANMEMFEKAGIQHIVTGDPHSFYTFTKEYPKREDGLTAQHYTQFLNELIDEGKLKLSTQLNKAVTYHDPCYLGRHSEVFEEPRKLIQAIPGVKLVEIEASKRESDCCGMGGGRMWTEFSSGFVSSQAIAEKRLQQALDTSAEVLLTACPFCNITMNDAVKSLEKEETIKVMDITELLCMSL